MKGQTNTQQNILFIITLQILNCCATSYTQIELDKFHNYDWLICKIIGFCLISSVFVFRYILDFINWVITQSDLYNKFPKAFFLRYKHEKILHVFNLFIIFSSKAKPMKRLFSLSSPQRKIFIRRKILPWIILLKLCFLIKLCCRSLPYPKSIFQLKLSP